MERKHKVIETMAQPRRNTQAYDQNLLEECTVFHLFQLEHHAIECVDLLGPKPASKKLLAELGRLFPSFVLEGAMTSKSAHVHCRAVQIGDCVSYIGSNGDLCFGVVLVHCRVQEMMITFVSVWDVLDVGTECAKCTVQDRAQMLRSESIVEPCIY